MFDAVLPLFNPGARMTICGLIAHYGDDAGTDARAALMARGEADLPRARRDGARPLRRRLSWPTTTTRFLAEVAPWVASGEVRYREDIREGLETIPAAFAEMLRGGNFGKMLVRVSEDPTL